MARSPLGPPDRRRPAGARGVLARVLRGTSRITVALVLLGLLAGGLALGRLAQGPVALPLLAEVVERRANLRLSEARVAIGGAQFGLGRAGAPSGLVFEDVRVTGADGTLLMAAPRLSARFDLSDLLLGRVRPRELALTLPRMAVLRAADGRIRVGLGTGAGLALGGGAAGPGMDAVAAVIDGFAGDAPLAPLLSRLDTVRVRDAEITYRDAATGRLWRTAGSDLALWRSAAGLRAVMHAALTEDGVGQSLVTLAAWRPAGTGETRLRLTVEGLDAGVLAAHLPGMGPLPGLAGRLDARLRVRLDRDGGIGALDGRLAARELRLPGVAGRLSRLDRLSVRLDWAPGPRRLELRDLTVAGPGLDARLSGHLAPGERGLGVDLRVGALALDAPALLPGAVTFDGGRLTGRLIPGEAAAQIATARLTGGEMTLAASGRVAAGQGGLDADLRLAARQMRVAALKSHWPFAAAPGARRWVAENLVSGRIRDLSGRLRLAGGEPALDLAFDFEEVVSRYLGEMPAIRGGRGAATLDLSRFALDLAEGRVETDAGPIRLGGSRLVISDLLGPAPPGDIAVEGAGATAAVLALIDHAPLGLVRRLGLDLGRVGGQARVTARLGFPMLADLAVADVDVAAEADLRDTRLTLPLSGARQDVTADRLALTATAEQLTLSGRARLAGQGIDIRWREDYGPGPGGRRLTAEGPVDRGVLTALGLDAPWVTGGTAAVALTLEGRGEATAVTLEADLTGAALAEAALRWDKPAGRPGRLSVSAATGPEGIAVERFALSAAGLSAEGRLDFDSDGALTGGRLSRLRLDDRADLTARIERRAGEGLRVSVAGPWLDLSGYLDRPRGESPATGSPLTIAAEIERLRLTPTILVAPAEARLERTAEGRISLDLSGTAGAEGRFTARYARAAAAAGEAEITAPDAGALLRGLGLFAGGTGGRLTAAARLEPGADGGVTGRADIAQMTVRDAETVGTVLAEGGVEEAAEAVEGGGLTFDTIAIPFTRRDGTIRIERAVARAPLLAVTLEGSVVEAPERLELRGVISPAYALTGALDEIPFLGTLLTGGRGEGILAMTFRVTGTIDDPEVTVNPLSLLTPGVLRSVFEGGSGQPSQRFLDQLGRGE